MKLLNCRLMEVTSTEQICCQVDLSWSPDDLAHRVEFHDFMHKPIDLISTTAGHIEGRSTLRLVEQPKSVVIRLARTNSTKLFCVASYQQNNLTTNEASLELDIPNVTHLSEKEIDIPVINDASSITSQWAVELKFDGDLTINVQRAGKTTTMFCLGETGEEIRSSDILFSLSPTIQKTYIPVEAVISRGFSSKIGIFVVVRQGLSTIQNLYRKIVVSNFVELSSFPQQQPRNLGEFSDIGGGDFSSHCWRIDNSSQLPVALSEN